MESLRMNEDATDDKWGFVTLCCKILLTARSVSYLEGTLVLLFCSSTVLGVDDSKNSEG